MTKKEYTVFSEMLYNGSEQSSGNMARPIFRLGSFQEIGDILQYDFKALTRPCVSWHNVFQGNNRSCARNVHVQNMQLTPIILLCHAIERSHPLPDVPIWCVGQILRTQILLLSKGKGPTDVFTTKISK